MRSLLQSKTVVSVLVVCAVLAVARQLKVHWRPGLVQGVARELETLAPATAVDPALAEGERLDDSTDWPDYRTNLVGWPRLFVITPNSRDPFVSAEDDSASVAYLESREISHDATQLVLHAVSVQPRGAFAVVNQQIVGVGESIGDYVVEQIRDHEVWLGHPQGRRVLRLLFGETESTLAIETPQSSQ